MNSHNTEDCHELRLLREQGQSLRPSRNSRGTGHAAVAIVGEAATTMTMVTTAATTAKAVGTSLAAPTLRPTAYLHAPTPTTTTCLMKMPGATRSLAG